MWGATFSVVIAAALLGVSIHAPRVGRDSFGFHNYAYNQRFNPRAPCGARPAPSLVANAPNEFQSTRPVWGATPTEEGTINAGSVSIHAPRVGRDGNWSHDFPLLPRIYGHSPPQIRFSRHLRPTPLLRHDSRTYIFTFCFLFTSPSHSVMNAQMMIAASKS